MRTLIWALAGLAFGAICVVVTACGGGEHHDSKFLLTMTLYDGRLENLFTYDSSHDCIGAGSYRVAVFPQTYVAFSCKEI